MICQSFHMIYPVIALCSASDNSYTFSLNVFTLVVIFKSYFTPEFLPQTGYLSLRNPGIIVFASSIEPKLPNELPVRAL